MYKYLLMLTTLFCCFGFKESNRYSHKCKYCGASYFYEDDLVYHIKYYHLDREEEQYLLNKRVKL